MSISKLIVQGNNSLSPNPKGSDLIPMGHKVGQVQPPQSLPGKCAGQQNGLMNSRQLQIMDRDMENSLIIVTLLYLA